MTGKVQNIHAVAADFCRGWKDEKGKVTFEEEDNWKQVKHWKGKWKKWMKEKFRIVIQMTFAESEKMKRENNI